MKFSFLFLFYFIIHSLAGQQSVASMNELSNNFEHGQYLFQSEEYGLAKITLQQFINECNLPVFAPVSRLVTTAKVDQAINALRLNNYDGEASIRRLIEDEYNKAEILPAILELASYYYNSGKYEDAISTYDKIIDASELSLLDMCELSFKKGYSYFIIKKFDEAKRTFAISKEFRNQYFYPVNYYYGMCQYFDNDFAGAVESFKRAANAPEYKNQIPYYLSQIYFAQKDFDKLISYAEQKISDRNTLNIKEIRLLLGQAYYQRNDFDRAINHLEFYEANTDKLTAEEFYQLAFTQYKLEKCDKATSNFLELTNLDAKMGQLSNYYLADCLLKSGDKNSAKAAFKKVSSMDYDPAMKEEARFNFGKLSAELGSDREAINVLLEVNENSRFYEESQMIINDILVNSGDYLNSIKIIESLPKLNENIQKTYQNLSLKQATQFFHDDSKLEALVFLEKSLKYPIDRNYHAQSLYWKAQIKNDDLEYNTSAAILDKYFEISNGINDLPEESSNYMAHYLQGYNYLKLKDYKTAEIQFKNCIVGININREEIKSDYILNRILPDGFVRAGDCLFKQRQFGPAKTFYEQAVSRKQGEYIYAIYQRGLIAGLLGGNEEKIATMSEIIQGYPLSVYTDDAYVQIADTYLSMGEGEKAASYFIDVMSKYGIKSPYYNTAQLKMGLITYNRGEIGKAMDYYKNVLNSDPSPKEKSEALKSLEEIYIEDLANSAAYLAFLDSIPGLDITGLSRDSLSYHLGQTLFGNAQYAAAVSAFSDYLVSFSLGYYKNDARYYRAEANNVLKAYSSSLQDYESIIADGPGKYYQKAMFKAALIAYNYTQDFEKSLRYYKEYEFLTGDVGEIFQSQYGALKSAFKLSKDTDVIRYGEKVVANNAATRDEKAAAYYYIAKSYSKQNNVAKAIESFEKVDKLTNNNQAAEARFVLAEFLFKDGKVDKAELQINYANEKNSNYPYWIAKGLMLLSDIYVVKNDLLNARAALEAVLENFKDDATIHALAINKLDQLKIKEANANRIKTGSNKVDLIDNKKN